MKTIGIYPGNFQPPHKGHLQAYKRLKQLVGPDAFVATTSKTPTPDAPLHLGEKQNIWVRHGVPADRIEKVEDWKHPKEIFRDFSSTHTAAVFLLNLKEFDSLHIRKGIVDNKELWLDNSGQPSYFQPYKENEQDMESLDKHGYVQIADDNKIDGKLISTANIRSGLGSPKYTEDQKKKFFQWAFGWFDIGLFQELTNKFKMAHSTSDSDQDFGVMPSLASLIQPNVINSPAPEVDKTKAKLQQTIKEIVKEILEEFMPPPSMTPSGDATSSGDNGLPGESERRKDTMLKRQDAMKKKAASERDLKTLQADLKWKESDVKKKRKDEIPNKRDEIDSLNKMAAAGSSP